MLLRLIFILTSLGAFANSNTHFPIMGDKSTTVGHLRANFDKMPGGQISDPITMNALSLGLGNRIEVGVIPWVYATQNDSFMKYGITLKYNFFKSKQFQFAVGGSQIKGFFKESKDDRDSSKLGSNYDVNFNQWWNYQFLSMNFTPSNKRYNLGFTIKYTEIISRSNVQGTHSYLQGVTKIDYPIVDSQREATYDSSYTIDMNYQLLSHNWLGFAVGTASLISKLNIDEDDSEIGESSEVRLVVGSSYIYRKKLGVLNNPRLSMTYFEGSGLQFGFSTQF